MADVPTFAVVPSFGRPCFEQAMKSVIPQVTHTYVIATESFDFTPGDYVDVIADFNRPKNISRWWNRGIDAAAHHADLIGASAWNVLVMNDDVIAPAGTARVLAQALRHRVINDEPCQALRAQLPVVAYPDNFQPDRPRFVFHQEAGPVDLTTRMSGWFFMIRGESGIRADETFEWFYGDDDLDWRAREMGGAVMVPGCAVTHLYPNEETARRPELTARTHVDRELFLAKWGKAPH